MHQQAQRGLPPGYIRGIELALALICQQNPDIEASLVTRLGQENTVLLAKDTKESNRLHKNWRKSKICKELNKKLNGDQAGGDDEEAMSSGDDEDAGIEQGNNAPLIHDGATTGLVTPQSGVHRLVGPVTVTKNAMEHLALTSLPSDCWHLLEVYSTYTQCWFPISEKLDVLKLSYSYPSHGLHLSSDMLDSGQHAEMWSVLTLSACRNISKNHGNQELDSSTRSRSMYKTTQSLIPNELGKFELGHVKALLNLALVNLWTASLDAAWVLVGAASRILTALDEAAHSTDSRYVHVVASCFVLDSLLGLALNRRPYLEKADVEHAGAVQEDGLEEWQPWVGELDSTIGHTSRLPTLALSSFNCLVDLVNILGTSAQHSDARRDASLRLSHWKSALNPKFDYIRTVATSIPLTPPAVLLQLAHFVTMFAISPSHSSIQRVLELMESSQERLGPQKLPPVIVCLLRYVERIGRTLTLDQTMRRRIEKIIHDFTAVISLAPIEGRYSMPMATNMPYAGRLQDQFATNEHLAPPFNPHFAGPMVVPQEQQAHSSSLLEDLLPDMKHIQQPQANLSPNAANPDLTSPNLDAYDPSIPGDLETFFDELASLHGAQKLQNQPQFMQNLGFAPEVSMADLLATQSGHFMPVDPSTFGTRNEAEPMQFPLSDYYDTG
ncbi:hypothetical protein ACEQ8H_001680 [Pleosporales sp. CAS-2024a]